MNNKKLKKLKQIGSIHFNGMEHPVTYGDLLSLSLDLQPSDQIDIERVEGFYSDNNSWDAHTNLVIYREIEETDEEFNKRLQYETGLKEELKKQRYESFLKLKKEFEPEPEISFHKTMNIFAMEGHKVKCSTFNAGMDYDQKKAERYLTVGNTYTVDHTVAESFSTEVYLKEFPLIAFNSVFFTDVEEQDLETTKKHPDYQRFSKF